MSRSRKRLPNVNELKALMRQPGYPVYRERADTCKRAVRWFWIDGYNYNDPSWIDRLARERLLRSALVAGGAHGARLRTLVRCRVLAP